MAKELSREQYIKKARRMRFIEKAVFNFTTFFRFGKSRGLRKQIFIDTQFGKVRTLWYGAGNTDVTPVHFDLHGGGFVLGSADVDETINVELSKQIGCKVVGIDYAKAPDYPFPSAVNQIYETIKHIYENADKFLINPQRMSIGGYSAGGNLSTVVCMKAKKEGLFQFICQVLDYPPLDLATGDLKKPHPQGSVSPQMAMMFNACYFDPSQAKDPYVSPVYAAKEELEGLPPALLILAGKDSLHEEGIKYQSILETSGVITECCDYPNAVHGFTHTPSADASDAFEKTVIFLKKYLQSAA
jgi:acetyl esterase